MVRRFYKAFFIFSLFFLFTRCAQIVPLTGGEPDRVPPKLLAAQPPNSSLNFTGNKIILRFDEYVQVRDLSNQLTVSPRLKTDPQVNAEGKNIVIGIDPKELLPNTTYRFAFGKAIADMHESNPAENFEYVFSTGPVIDTLRLSGTVSDVLTRRPLKDVTVGLYRGGMSDSLPYITPADYISRSDESGSFNFRNLPRAEYRVYAIDDRNKNSVYDGETEKAGLVPETLHLLTDSSLNIVLFQEEPSKLFVKKTISPFYGFTQILLNQKARVSVMPYNKNESSLITEANKGKLRDTVPLFYRQIGDSLKILLRWEQKNRTDTLQVMLPRNNRNKRVMGTYQVHAPGGAIPFRTRPKLIFPVWMDTTRANGRAFLLWKTDTLQFRDTVEGSWTEVNVFEMSNNLTAGITYTLVSDTGSFFDVHGSTIDSVKQTFRTHAQTEFGKVTLKLSLNRKQPYVIQLIDERMSTVRETTLSLALSSSNTSSLVFEDLAPGTYQVRVVFDDNGNGKWDTGNMLRKLLPENAEISPKLIKVVADWEIEEDISLKSVK